VQSLKHGAVRKTQGFLMGKHVCPWWLGYFLLGPWRRWLQDPEEILKPYMREGMIVLDIGAGMGFFTLPAATMVGDSGRVIALDIQERMLRSLVRRAKKAGLGHRIHTQLCKDDDLGVSEGVDLCLAFNVVHEVPDARALFAQIRTVLKPAGKVLLIEPKGHVSESEFRETLDRAFAESFKVVEEPEIWRSRTAVLELDIRMSRAGVLKAG
jgi:ubiquinone/menaquinone biosynthesis C-methylase UbiE